jgi:hypothetical protein
MARCPRIQGAFTALLVRPAVFDAGRQKPHGRFTFTSLFSPSHAAVGLGKNLFPLFARSLDLASDFFNDKVRTLLLTSDGLDYV